MTTLEILLLLLGGCCIEYARNTMTAEAKLAGLGDRKDSPLRTKYRKRAKIGIALGYSAISIVALMIFCF